MRGGRFNFTPDATFTTDAVERAVAENKEECELRLARIANGADPVYKNGPIRSKLKEKAGNGR